MKQHPRYNVVSMRVSDEEKEMLLRITRSSRKSLSDIMREALCCLKVDMVGFASDYAAGERNR